MASSPDQPTGRRTLGEIGAFIAVWLASQMVIVYLLTGEWGGTIHDPLWVGPVSAGLALFNAVGMCVAAVLMADSWKELERG